MHRRGLRCLIDVHSVSRACSPRYHTAVQNPRSSVPPSDFPTERKVTPSPSVARHATKRDKDRSGKRRHNVDPVAFTQELLEVAAKNPRSFHREPKRGENVATPKLAAHHVQSEEVREFLAEDSAAAADGDDDHLNLNHVQPGVFVELRRNAVEMHGVVLGMFVDRGMHIIATLTSSGEVLAHRAADIMFQIPGFADEAAVTRCGIALPTDRPLDEHENAARVEILKNLAVLERRLEAVTHDTALLCSRALRDLRPSDPHEWSTTSVADLATLISGGQTPSVLTMLAVHKYLMRSHREYVSPGLSALVSQAFWVRPTAVLANLNYVEDLVARRDPLLLSFLEKARQIISSRSSLLPRSSEFVAMPHPTITFTEDDQAIIQFLQNYLRARRSTQKDPYQTSVVIMMRLLGLYPNEILKGELVHRFLVDIGVLSPWTELDTIGANLEAKPIVKRAPETAITVPHSPGLNEFYPEDIVADLRHDFGDLPVYVIDDVRAEELDDGISIERVAGAETHYWVHVHVADPTSLLHPKHAVSKRARDIVNSRYFITGTEPMLPQSTVYGGLSLGSGGTSQKAMTFSFKLNESGELVDYAVRPSIIRNRLVLTYNQVDEALGFDSQHLRYPFGQPQTPSVARSSARLEARHLEDFRALDEVRQRLTQWTMRQNTVAFHRSDAYLFLMNTSFPDVPDRSRPYLYQGDPQITYAVSTKELTRSRRMVAEAMKGAGRVASLFFRDRDVPALRRAVPPLATSSEQVLTDLLEKRNEFGDVEAKEMYKAKAVFLPGSYSLEPKGHWQLGIPEGEGYVRVTSPLRRFSDMLHHWQIKYALLGQKEHCFSRQWLTVFGTELGLRERENLKREDNHLMFWALRFIEQFGKNPHLINGRNPLDDLEAVSIGPSKIDRLSGSVRCRIWIESLALVATVVDAPPDLDTGSEFKVKYDSVRYGTQPMLIAKLT